MKRDYWLLLVSLASWAALLFVVPRLPEQIPMHWGIDGEVDRYGSRLNLLWLGGLGTGIWLLMTWLPAIDPGRRNYARFTGSYRLIRLLIVGLMIALVWLSVAASLREGFDLVFFIKILLGLLFIGIGNQLSRIRINWFVGIRTPWTLSDPDIWRKTHRLAGFLMVLAGVSFLVSAVFLTDALGFWLPMVILVGGVVVDVLYSALLWQRLKD